MPLYPSMAQTSTRIRCRLPESSAVTSTILHLAPGAALALLTAGAMSQASLSAPSCTDFFENLAPGSSGSCADIAFFGFDGTAIGEFGFVNQGQTAAAIDLSGQPEPLPVFFTPATSNLASVRLQAEGETGLAGFVIEHQGAVGMLPLADQPPAGVSSNRFIATGTRNRTVFTAHNSAPGVQTVAVEIALEQNLELADPIDSGVQDRIGAAFNLKAIELDTGILLTDLRGSALFDSAEGPVPGFGDPFSPDPGYQGFTTSLPGQGGLVSVTFVRTLQIEIEEDSEIELETIVDRHVFCSGFDNGASSAATAAGPTTFNFAVRSPEPGISFNLKIRGENSALTVPSLEVDRLDEDRIRLTWDAVDTQDYVILFTPDLSLPQDQWEERETVRATSGFVQRDFLASGPSGFYALRTIFP